MSCRHGNHLDACDLCADLLAEFRSGIEQGKREGWEACEACHGIVDGKHTEAESLREQLAATADLKDCILCDAEPAGWNDDALIGYPLYRARTK